MIPEILFLPLALAGLVLGVIALVQLSELRKQMKWLRGDVDALRGRLTKMERPITPPTQATPTIQATHAPEAPAGQAPVPAVEKSVKEPAIRTPPLVATASTTPPPPTAFTPSASRPMHPPVKPMAPPGEDLRSLESRIGQRWIAWVGAVVVFLSMVFFLKLAFQNQWIGPTGQVTICALASVAMLAAGSRFVAKKWRILGQVTMGLGLAVLYATFYSAFAVYEHPVMSQTTAFGFMVAVTIAGMALAVLHDAVSMAFLAVLGGMLTPVLVSTGQDGRDVLFTYVLLLDLGVLGVAFFKGWRALDFLALVGTVLMYGGWYTKFYGQEKAALQPALLWLGGFYVLFLVLPFCYHLVRKQELTLERFIMALGNALFAGAYAWELLVPEYRFMMGFVFMGMAAAYVVLGALVRRRLPNDARALFGLIALSVTCLTLAVPMQLHAHGILLAWLVEAPVLTYLAYRFRYRPLRVFAAIVLLVGVGRLFFSDDYWPLHIMAFVPFFNTSFLSAIMAPLAAWALALIHHLHRKEATKLDRGLQLFWALAGGILALVILHSETYQWLRHDMSELTAAAGVTAIWAVGAGVYLWAGTRARQSSVWVWGAGTLALIVATVLCAASFDVEAGKAHLLLANFRFAAGLLTTAAAFGYAWVIYRQAPNPQSPSAAVGKVFYIAGIVGLLMLLSTEAYTFCVDTTLGQDGGRRAGQMAITLVWGLYAGAMLVIGFWRRLRPLRIGGLALFGVGALKLVLMDLTYLPDVYRVVSFLILGLLMLAASYLYHRLEKRLTARPAAALEGDAPAAGETQ